MFKTVTIFLVVHFYAKSVKALMAKLVRRYTSNVAILSSNLSEGISFFCSVLQFRDPHQMKNCGNVVVVVVQK